MRRFVPLVAGVLVGISCGGERVVDRPKTVEIAIQDIAFAVPTASAKVGDTVEWINKDVIAHTATAKDRAWDVVIAPNEKGRLVAERPGTVDYYCTYHPNMTAKLVIEPR